MDGSLYPMIDTAQNRWRRDIERRQLRHVDAIHGRTLDAECQNTSLPSRAALGRAREGARYGGRPRQTEKVREDPSAASAKSSARQLSENAFAHKLAGRYQNLDNDLR